MVWEGWLKWTVVEGYVGMSRVAVIQVYIYLEAIKEVYSLQM